MHPHPEQRVEMLRRYPLFRTTSPDQMIYGHLSAFGALRGEVRNRDGFAAWGNLLQLPGIALGFGGSTVATAVDYSEVPQFRWQVARRGRAEISISGVKTTIDQDHGGIISSGRTHRIACGDHHDRLSLALNARAVERTVMYLLGVRPKTPLVFDIATDLRNSHAQYLQNLLLFLANQFDSDAAPLPALVVRELEQAVIVAFLRANRNSFSHFLEGDVGQAAPREVHRGTIYRSQLGQAGHHRGIGRAHQCQCPRFVQIIQHVSRLFADDVCKERQAQAGAKNADEDSRYIGSRCGLQMRVRKPRPLFKELPRSL